MIIIRARTATSGSVLKNLTYLHQMAVELLFEIADCLTWEYIITIFPSFQISRDNASMDVNLIKRDISCAADICFKRGSSNELLRSRKIPNSVTVHRRLKIVEAHNSDSTNPINVVMFDTFVDANGSESDANASDRLIGADIDEDDCSMARVKTKGSAESFIISSLEELRCTREDTLDPGIKLALSPFLVPTGRPCITFKNSNISLPDGEHPPSPKLFSMVLSARDQTDIYACSLVLYRSVLLKKIPLTIKVANKVQLDKADSTMQLKKDSGKTISNSSLNEFLTRPAAVGSQGRECATFVDDVDNVPQTSPLQPGTVESSPCYISLTNAGIEDLSNAALSLKKVSRIVASDLAAVLPTELDKLSTVQSDCSPESINLQTTISCPYTKVGPSQFFSNFSDDESAGLLSSTTEDIPTAARIEQVNLEINPKISQSVNAQKQGSFAEFLSATATVTASMASAIAIQAGSLPTTKFSWVTPTFNQAASTTDSKRFYDNLNFSRFKTMTFANAQSARQGDAAYGSSLKRKFDEYPAGESITYKLSGNSPLLDSSSSHQLTSPSSAISSAHSESPIFPLRKDNSASTATFHFSPDKQSLSSYPRFGHKKALKRSAVSPHNSSRSPRHKSITRHQSRRSRVSNLHSTVDIGLSSRGSKNHIPSSKPIHKLNLLACPSHEKLLIPTLIADMDALDLAISDSMLTTAASQSTTEDNLASVNDSAVAIAEAETPGVSFVAHGVFLFTKDPLIEKLRAAAAAIALDYEDHYMHSDTIWTIPKSVSVGLMDSFCMNLNPTTVPTSITSKRNDCSTPDYNSAVVLEALSAKNLVTVLIAFLLEYRIVVVSSKSLSAATHLGEWLKDAIRPLNYTHVYSPLVPPNIGLQLIHCPAPFFIGMKRSSLIDEVVELEDERDREKNKGRRNKSSSNRDNSGCGLLVVDMDRDECSIPLDLCTPVRAARVFIRALELILHPQLSHCDELIMLKPSKSALHTADNVMHLCKTFVNSMLLGSKLCSLDVDDGEEKIVLFDEVLFIQQHLTRISLGTEALALLSARQIKVKEDKVQGGRDFVKAAEDENGRIDIKTFLPATAGGAKDFEKLLRSLLRTQSFSSYLTS